MFFSEADNTGSFTGKEETLFWNAVEHADIYKQHHTSRVWKMCMSVVPFWDRNQRTCWSSMVVIPLFKWERLPPTRAAFDETVKRTLFQCIVWNFDIVIIVCPLAQKCLAGKKKRTWSYLLYALYPSSTVGQYLVGEMLVYWKTGLRFWKVQMQVEQSCLYGIMFLRGCRIFLSKQGWVHVNAFINWCI